jgi:hypothetical protein
MKLMYVGWVLGLILAESSILLLHLFQVVKSGFLLAHCYTRAIFSTVLNWQHTEHLFGCYRDGTKSGAICSNPTKVKNLRTFNHDLVYVLESSPAGPGKGIPWLLKEVKN